MCVFSLPARPKAPQQKILHGRVVLKAAAQYVEQLQIHMAAVAYSLSLTHPSFGVRHPLLFAYIKVVHIALNLRLNCCDAGQNCLSTKFVTSYHSD